MRLHAARRGNVTADFDARVIYAPEDCTTVEIYSRLKEIWYDEVFAVAWQFPLEYTELSPSKLRWKLNDGWVIRTVEMEAL